jgi:AcrR family transcriptional regulator
MTDRMLPLLGDAGGPPTERSDAARNREALLVAARRLVDQCGASGVTMEAVAAEAGVGKGTVFRRFQSRSNLMAALLDYSEAAWQAEVMSGEPPLGPGAPPLDRLLAFGRSRLRANVEHGELILAASERPGRSYAAYTFVVLHVQHLLRELGIEGDLTVLTTALLAPLEAVVLRREEYGEDDLAQLEIGWADLVRRIVS